MNLNAKLLSDRAKLPVRATDGSAGADLYACIDESITLLPMQRALVSTGIAISVPYGYAAFVYARSGLAVKHGITLSNCVGVIDSDYRGEIKVGLINQSDLPYTIEHGERIAQMVISKVELCDISKVNDLDNTDRGAGGFGSTGKI